MSQLTKSLELRIRELTKSIEADKGRLAAYEHVLQMELAGEKVEAAPAAEIPAPVHVAPAPVAAPAVEVAPAAPVVEAPAAPAAEVTPTTNKTALVASIVKSYGSTGASPKDVDSYFTAHSIERSKNLVYNTLSYLVAQKKLQRRNGVYFAIDSVPAKGKKVAAVKKTRTLSPEGLKRIKDALKKRWAAKRAADKASGAATKKAAKKA
jgi:F0F1-type ATP synthase delta subunit